MKDIGGFFGCGEGGGHGEGERDCILHHQCHGTNKKNEQVCEFAWKELDKMSLHLDHNFYVILI